MNFQLDSTKNVIDITLPKVGDFYNWCLWRNSMSFVVSNWNFVSDYKQEAQDGPKIAHLIYIGVMNRNMYWKSGSNLWPIVWQQAFTKIWPTDLVLDHNVPLIEHDLDIIKTNIQSKFEEDWVKTKASKELTCFY